MKKFLKILVITILALVVIVFAGMWAMSISPIGMGMHDAVYQADGVAIDGYDPVAYFDEGTPTKGSAEFSTEHDGVSWYFSNDVHLDAFKQNPEKYMPQIGGHCAFAASTGIAAPCDGEYFSIVDGELYMLSNPDVKTSFDQDAKTMAAKVKENWE